MIIITQFYVGKFQVGVFLTSFNPFDHAAILTTLKEIDLINSLNREHIKHIEPRVIDVKETSI